MKRDDDRHTGTIALVAGAGVLAYLLLRGGRGAGWGGAGTGDDIAGEAKPRTWCHVRLDGKGLSLEGRPVSKDEAIAACRAADAAEVLVTGDSIAGAVDDLLISLRRAGVRMFVRGANPPV
jgi:hypothetical protein